ncbi:PEP-CTERM sorting domain-containing protein [Roseomonas sp. AR75]|uniref:PEP-CTERM sorting domain-containing protein n=1 Tax=Roseomonas sp. AR75 TaxID=2562311 RepID=UPI001485BC44|nr:PEP-CTERM sorting domain-containing protein [Roseomonas sp. AR75]
MQAGWFGRAAGGVALALGLALAAAPAKAAFVFTMQEVAGGVELNGSGTINTAALTIGDPNSFGVSGVLPNEGVIRGGNGSFDLTEWFGVTGPVSFGPGTVNKNTTARSGDPLVLVGIYEFLLLPDDYVSGSQLSNTGFFGGSTFASLGVTPGTYVWTWGREDQADSLTLKIIDPTAVPAPASAALFGAALLGLAALRRRLPAPAAG